MVFWLLYSLKILAVYIVTCVLNIKKHKKLAHYFFFCQLTVWLCLMKSFA